MWQRNLELAFEHYPVVILHGNVRDHYVGPGGLIYTNLTSLLRNTLFNRSSRFSELIIYSGTTEQGRGRRIPLDAEPAVSQSQPDAPSPHTADLGNRPSIFFGIMDRQLREPAPSRVVFVNYFDKAVQFRQGGVADANERECLYFVEKTIENMHPENRMVLVTLTDGRIPHELYHNNPRVRLVEIPPPDTTERLSLLRARLLNWPIESIEEAKDLTAGLFLQQVSQVALLLEPLGANGVVGSTEIQQVVNQVRIGVRKDFWAELPIQDFDEALRRCASPDRSALPANVSLRAKAFDQIKGQRSAIESTLDSLVLARAGLGGAAARRTGQPRAVMLFAGPTGVGKTLLAKRMAMFLFGSEESFIRLDMSEFKEEHSLSKLVGSPPGYVGFESGGALTNAVREKPFSVILFDEIEKAHTKILDIFLQILDDGRLTDSRGQVTFFSEAVIVLTSNVGTRKNPVDEHSVLQSILSDQGLSDPEKKSETDRHFVNSVQNFFRFEISRPELLNRIGSRIIPFAHIDDSAIQMEIIRDQLAALVTNFAAKYRQNHHRLSISNDVAPWLLHRFGRTFNDFGGRGITNAISQVIEVKLARSVLAEEFRGSMDRDFVCRVADDDIVVEAT